MQYLFHLLTARSVYPPMDDVNRMSKLARGLGHVQQNMALDSDLCEIESGKPL